MTARPSAPPAAHEVNIDLGDGIVLGGLLDLPADAQSLVIFAHGSGSGRFSPRNQQTAQTLVQRGVGTLLFDLLTRAEGILDESTRTLRFDIPLLARRLVAVTTWAKSNVQTQRLRIGYFGASTGAAAALIAASQLPGVVRAVVSRGGRPDLAGPHLASVQAPTLLIVGSLDDQVIRLNEAALRALGCVRKELVLVPGATHLFEEPGTLQKVCDLAGAWIDTYLGDGQMPSLPPYG